MRRSRRWSRKRRRLSRAVRCKRSWRAIVCGNASMRDDLPPVNVSRIVDHIDHIVKLVGVDHVGIGSDFDGVQITTADLATVAELPNLTKELLRRGYSESDVNKILGGNMLRVMEAQAVDKSRSDSYRSAKIVSQNRDPR